MQAKQLTAVLVAALAVAAPASQAQDRPLTRAEVKAELARAQASGEHQRMQTDYLPTMQDAPRSVQRRDSTGAGGRSYSKPAAASVTTEKSVPLPMGDEGE
jgi:hypothetical protein